MGEEYSFRFPHHLIGVDYNLEELAVMTPKKFAIKIETIVKTSGTTYMDAILDYCEKNQMET